MRVLRENRSTISYGNGLDVEFTDWQLAKIAEIKNRKNLKPLKWGDIHCAWPGCPRKALEGRENCWKHGKLVKALGAFIRDY
jgi:hypothetical protein